MDSATTGLRICWELSCRAFRASRLTHQTLAPCGWSQKHRRSHGEVASIAYDNMQQWPRAVKPGSSASKFTVETATQATRDTTAVPGAARRLEQACAQAERSIVADEQSHVRNAYHKPSLVICGLECADLEAAASKISCWSRRPRFSQVRKTRLVTADVRAHLQPAMDTSVRVSSFQPI